MPLLPPRSLVLLVGPPAAGKTTLAAALVAAGEVRAEDVVGTDPVRESLLGDALDVRHEGRVFAEVRRRLDERLAAGRTTVVDATNLWPRRRARHLRVARAHGRPVVAIRFDVPLDVLVERNAARERRVPVGGLVTMARQLRDAVPPETLRAEGVDVVLDAAEVYARVHTAPEE